MVGPGKAVERVAADAHHVVWEAGPLESETQLSRLFERSLAGGWARPLAANVDPGYGLASTFRWTAYAGAGRRLRPSRTPARSEPLSRRRPDPRRGAWRPNRLGGTARRRQRAVVRDMAADRTVLSVSMPLCKGKRCYELEQVTLVKKASSSLATGRIPTNPSSFASASPNVLAARLCFRTTESPI